MTFFNWDWSRRGRARVYVLSALGTIACILLAFAFDSYSFKTGQWRWGSDPVNNLLIPLVIAPPFFLFLLSKLRELAIAHHELMTVASTDSLTCLLNRRAFTELVDTYLERIKKNTVTAQGALLLVDVDHFKSVNDRFGHDRGDEALKLVARSIKCAVRDIDLVGRLGGEEFCVFVAGLPVERIGSIAERIRAAVNETQFLATEEPYQLSVSVGGATFVDEADFSSLYRCADQWLYFAKKHGRNRVEIRKLASFDSAGVQVARSLH